MGKSKIQWTDMSWPVVTGCSHAGFPGCDSCYAARMAATRLKHHPRYKGLATFSNGKARWTGEVRLNHDVLEQPLRWRKPRRVFVASMGDLFHEGVPFDFVDLVFLTMTACNGIHSFQLLTKRPGRMLEYFNSRQYYSSEQYHAHSLPNIHLGVSVENQAASDDRREDFERCPAAVKFVSYEPALGPVDWTGWEFVSQIISGGESGPGARPSHPDWHRATRDFCQENEIAYFFKAWGEWLQVHPDRKPYQFSRPANRCTTIGPDRFYRIGKKRAGHLLDGRAWQEFPVAERSVSK